MMYVFIMSVILPSIVLLSYIECLSAESHYEERYFAKCCCTDSLY
jgi:hypothetical protein